MRGRRPTSCSKSSAALMASWRSAPDWSGCCWCRCLLCPYTPATTLPVATCRPQAASRAPEISPTVARARAAWTASSSRLVSLASDLAAASRACSTAATPPLSLPDLTVWRRATCCARTSALLMDRTSIASCTASGEQYLLTPTMVCLPLSMSACCLEAHSSILCLGIPAAMASVMPPAASTSSITRSAAFSICRVRLSMK
mmetsp:Transcript_31498/g.89402  ORF Transcript_31498/g.89402 Transcript_31498/m.89402 type:complete len:201 (+) Transcript_31498:647-1249(+)